MTGNHTRGHKPFILGGLAALLVSGGLLSLASAGNPEKPEKKPWSDRKPIVVQDKAGRVDLGEIPVKSVHKLSFDVVNGSDRPITIKKIRTDCKCIRAVDPPEVIRPEGRTRVKVKFVAPAIAVPYRTRLVLITDAPDRRLISLWVKCKAVRP